jgi:Asp-tRNA(Asn)/Glu-tRNA(Gln) amidotransferase A subunit family amidase
VAARPSAKRIRIGRLYLDGTDPAIDRAIDAALAAKGFRVVRLGETFKAKWVQAQALARTAAVVDAGVWFQAYLDKAGVTTPTKATILLGRADTTTTEGELRRGQRAWQRELRRVFRGVDFIALPTLQTIPPRVPLFGRSALFEGRVFLIQNTVAVNFAGNPALAMPVPLEDRAVPVTSLQLIGPRLSEAELLNAGRLIGSREQ